MQGVNTRYGFHVSTTCTHTNLGSWGQDSVQGQVTILLLLSPNPLANHVSATPFSLRIFQSGHWIPLQEFYHSFVHVPVARYISNGKSPREFLNGVVYVLDKRTLLHRNIWLAQPEYVSGRVIRKEVIHGEGGRRV